jgi:hypothetical protein
MSYGPMYEPEDEIYKAKMPPSFTSAQQKEIDTIYAERAKAEEKFQTAIAKYTGMLKQVESPK